MRVGFKTGWNHLNPGTRCCRRRRQWHPTPVLLPGKSYGQRSPVGCSPWGCEESDTTEWLHFLFSLSCIGEGNGNPLQSSCLENPRDGGAWWAAVYGVTQSRTWLKRLSSSSNRFNSFQEECIEEKAMGKQLPDHCGQRIEGFQNLWSHDRTCLVLY